MNRLAQEMARVVSAHVKAQVANLDSQTAEYRAVFNGPPLDLLIEVFELLAAEGGIASTRRDGTAVVVPVVVKVVDLQGRANPPIGKSGQCDDGHLLALRNSPHCPIYIALLPPGNYANLSQASTRSDFGLTSHNNSGAASIEEWWGDRFVQALVRSSLDRHAWPSDEMQRDATRLVEHAVLSADEVVKHDVARRGPWDVLSRLWAISADGLPFGSMVSLATGFPPVADGSVDSLAQRAVLAKIAGRFAESGFGPTFANLKGKSPSAQVGEALSDLLHQLQRKCDVPAALAQSTPYYYGPFTRGVLGPPPEWWRTLTFEVWTDLLEEEEVGRDSVSIVCLNSFVSQSQGFIPVTSETVQLRFSVPEEVGEVEIDVIREGGKARQEWRLRVRDGQVDLHDDQIPSHKSPLRYSAIPVGSDAQKRLKKGAIRVICIAKWEPGAIACSRSAAKTTVPKAAKANRDKVAFEQSIDLTGPGRHYIDLYTRNGVATGNIVYRSDETGALDQGSGSPISSVNENEHGFEVEVDGESFYQFELLRDEAAKPDAVRVYLSCEEASAEACSSEFERLIKLNKHKEGARPSADVSVNYQVRCSVLQGWLLAEDKVRSSYYPLVLAPDYARDWRTRDWRSMVDTVLSQGRYLHDPRPRPEDMNPPAAFVEARAALAARVRGDDNSLIEAARLGEWAASDLSFAELVERYVRSYADWLESAPEAAAWCDVAIVTRFEMDGTTLVQDPDAILVSPLHPLRFAWHCLAQRSLYLAHRKKPCPAASILDPDCVPDTLSIPLVTASGSVKQQLFFSVECSSDYWGVMWNASKLDRIHVLASDAPFDQDFGILVGGLSSGFSVSQVHRAMDDISSMLVAKPVLNVLLSSAAGQNNACNEGIISWCRGQFVSDGRKQDGLALGAGYLQVLDERRASVRPDDAEISNLAEDTANAVRWYTKDDRIGTPDLGIIAQLETSNPGFDSTKVASSLSAGGLVRSRIRQQLSAGKGALLSESRTSLEYTASGDGLADNTARGIVRLENLGDQRVAYVFAPSVPTVQAVLDRAEYAAVSSSSVDPACFLGGWLKNSYLWDYDLPSYSSRSGDSNGYYLLSRIKPLDRETLQSLLASMPGCKDVSAESVDEVILEVSRRGIPTVRGLSKGNSGAAGSLGLFVATRLLQDEFRTDKGGSLLPIWDESPTLTSIALVIPVDPFTGHLEDLRRALKLPTAHRPDLLVIGLELSDSKIRCHLTPIEVKYRGGKDAMPSPACKDALAQCSCLSVLLTELSKQAEEPELMLWRIAFQHLVASIVSYGFRVYSQQLTVTNKGPLWAEHQARVVAAIYSNQASLSVDPNGRLIVIDGSLQSAARDFDGDSYSESIVLCHGDAAAIVKGHGAGVYDAVKRKVGLWGLFPPREGPSSTAQMPAETPIGAARPEAPTPLPAEPVSDDTGGPAFGLEPKAEGVSAAPAGDLPPSDSTGAQAVTTPNAGVGGGIRIQIGMPLDGFSEQAESLHLGGTKLNQLNIGVVGDLGTGKTQLTKSLIYQICRSREANAGVQPNFLIFDYKKDYSAPEFVNAVGAKVLVPHQLPINLFDIANAGGTLTPWLDRFRFFADVLDKIYSGLGPVQRNNLKAAVRKAYDQAQVEHRQPNIYDVHANYQDLLGGKTDSAFSIMDDLVDMELFAPQSGSFADHMKGVVVVALNELGQDDQSKNMVVAIMLNLFYEHMIKIPKRPFFGPAKELRVVDSYLLVDEADNIMKYEFDVLKRILLQGREFGVGVILASQYLRHFKAGATDYRDPLVTWFIHKVPNVTPQELGALGMTGDLSQVAERIKSLGLHECLYKSIGSPEFLLGVPFYKLYNS